LERGWGVGRSLYLGGIYREECRKRVWGERRGETISCAATTRSLGGDKRNAMRMYRRLPPRKGGTKKMIEGKSRKRRKIPRACTAAD